MSLNNEALSCVIRERINGDMRIAAMAIDICSEDGCVSIRGCVDTYEQKKLIVDLVTGMIGVKNLCCANVLVKSERIII